MRRLLPIFLFLCLTGLVQAADVLQSSLSLGSYGGGNVILGSPRDYPQALAEAGKVAWFRAAFASNRANIFLSEDYGVSIADSLRITDGNIVNYHAHLWSRGDTLYHTPNNQLPLDDFRIYRYDLEPTITLMDCYSLDMVISGTPDDSYIGGMVHWQKNGPGMVAVKRSSISTAHSGLWATSGDNGDNWTWATSRVYSITQDVRLGVIQTGGDSAICVIYENNTEMLRVFAFNGTAWNAVGTNPVESGTQYYVRDFDMVVDLQGTVHVVISDTAALSQIHHYYKRVGDAGWTETIPHTSTRKEGGFGYDSNRGMRVCLTLSEYDGAVRLCYASSWEESSVDYRRLYCTTWNPSTLSWGTAWRVGTDNQITEITGANRVPYSHGSTSYIQTASGTTTWAVRLLRIYNSTAGGYIEANAQVKISSLPYTVTDANHSTAFNSGLKKMDTIAIIGARLNSATDGITFSSTSNWHVVGQGDTVTFSARDASSTATGLRGLNLSSCDSIFVEDLYIIEDVTGIDTTQYLAEDAAVHDNAPVYVAGGNWYSRLINCYIEARSYNTHTIEFWDAAGFLGSGCTINSKVWAFASRCQYDGAAVYSTHNTTAQRIAAGASYNIRFENTRIIRTPHQGFSFYRNVVQVEDPPGVWTSYPDSAVFQLDNCYVMVDAENWRYTAYAGTCCGKANCYGIQVVGADDGSYFKKCTVLAGENNTGGRGIQLVGTLGLESGAMVNPVYICSSYVNVHEGGDIEFYDTILTNQQEYFPCAIKIRQENYGTIVYDSYFKYTADGAAPWSPLISAYYPRGETGMYQLWAGTSDPTPCRVQWYRNKFVAEDRSNGAFVTAFVFEDIDFLDSTLEFYNNRLESDSVFIRLGGRDTDFGVLVDSIHSCTLVSIDPNDRVVGYIHGWRALDGGYFNAQTAGFTTRDMVYLNYAGSPIPIDTSIYFPDISREQDQKNHVTVEITVIDSLDNPIPNASVLLTNGYFTVLFDGFTDAQGKVTRVVPIWYESRTQPDLFGYNDHQVTVSYGGLAADSTKTFTSSDKSLTVRLGTAAQPAVRKHFHGWMDK